MTNPEHTIKTSHDGKRVAAQRRHHERAMDETVRDAPAVKRVTGPTAGPWETNAKDFGIYTADDRLIATARTTADMQLIGASPEMLAQLKHCYAMAMKLRDDKWAAEIKAVIVRALGDVAW